MNELSRMLGLPISASSYGSQLDSMVVWIHIVMFVLFIGWSAFIVYVLWRFRASKNPKANYTGVTSHLSSYLETGVIIIELVWLFAMSIPFWSSIVDTMPPQGSDSMAVRVIGQQFQWNIHYPGPDNKFGKTDVHLVDANNPLGLDYSDADAQDDVTTRNQLTIPVNKNVITHIGSKDVIHCFAIPLMRLRQDAIPGMSVPQWFKAINTSDEVRESYTKRYNLERKSVAVKTGIELSLVAEDVPAQNITRGTLVDEIMIDDLRKAGKSEIQIYSGLRNLFNPLFPHVFMRDVAKDSNTLAKKGEAVTPEIISAIANAGITEIWAAPETCIEIACAQLCGLGHYYMKGFVTVHTQENFNTWMNEQVEKARKAAPEKAKAQEGKKAEIEKAKKEMEEKKHKQHGEH